MESFPRADVNALSHSQSFFFWESTGFVSDECHINYDVIVYKLYFKVSPCLPIVYMLRVLIKLITKLCKIKLITGFQDRQFQLDNLSFWNVAYDLL